MEWDEIKSTQFNGKISKFCETAKFFVWEHLWSIDVFKAARELNTCWRSSFVAHLYSEWIFCFQTSWWKLFCNFSLRHYNLQEVTSAWFSLSLQLWWIFIKKKQIDYIWLGLVLVQIFPYLPFLYRLLNDPFFLFQFYMINSNKKNTTLDISPILSFLFMPW